MRSHDVLTALALFGAACSPTVGAEQLRDGASNGAATIDANAGVGGSGGVNDGAVDGQGGSSPEDGGGDNEGAVADCGMVAAPNAWPGWIMPNPVKSGLPNPASYTVSDGGNQVNDDVTGLVWQRVVESSTYTWEDAKRYCACLTLDGVAGWRLP